MQHTEADAGRSLEGGERLETMQEPEPASPLDALPLLDPEPEPEAPSGTNVLELWSDRREVEAIPDLLRPGEGVVCVGSGTIVRTGRLSQPRWLVVLTDRRVLCVRGAVAATRRIIDMPVGAIRSVERKGFLRSTVTLDTGYGNLRIGGLKKPLAAELLDGLQALMRAHEGDSPTAIPRARLPEAPGGVDDHVTETIAALRTEVEDLRARVAALELASGRPSV